MTSSIARISSIAFAAALAVAMFSSPAWAEAPATQSASQPASAPASAPATAPAPVSSAPAPAATAPASAPATQTSTPAPVPPKNENGVLAIHNDDVVVFLGDELTDTPRPTSTNSFPMLVETFLAARYPSLHAHFVNVGWSGDTATRALLRLDRDVLSQKPTVVVICLGLNDPEYLPFAQERLDAFARDLLTIVQKCQQAGARVWLLSPPSVDEDRGRKVRIQRAGRPGITDLQAIGYNATLQRYAQAMKSVAEKTTSGFVDWFAESAGVRAAVRQTDPDFSLTSNGLNPTDRTQAMAAASLLSAWKAQPIHVSIAVNWSTGEVKLKSHLASSAVTRTVIDAAGERRLALTALPLPWPMAGGQAGFLAGDWEAARLCQFILQVADPPERGATLRFEWPQGTQATDQPVAADQLRKGINLASLEGLNSAKEITELFQLIGTKNYYHYGTWRKLALSPPKEAELVEAHRKLIEAWNSYVAGTERIIFNQPRMLNLQLVLSEPANVEQLPTAPPPTAPAPPPAASPPATAPAVPSSAPAVETPTPLPASSQPVTSQPAATASSSSPAS